ncbi:HEPN-associated N-terminal domain-containing protein [Thiohalorhabdus methylotrophus]|uniref:HEPN-associated N-terminal domain-containing protein n=1 Tax=Thiohalorhabdus methylotrophus TaxID=3242694 RepID=A0ABV4TZ81_9GAMM
MDIGELYVCAECFNDPDLKSLINSSDEDPGCDICRGSDAPTAKLDIILSHIQNCIEEEYDLAANCLPWESREGGWQFGKVWDTHDLVLDEIGLELQRDEEGILFEKIIEYLGGPQDWCLRNPFGRDKLEILWSGWEGFSNTVKYKTRFFLDRIQEGENSELKGLDPDPSPAETLKSIGDIAERLDLFRTLSNETPIFRTRFSKNGEKLTTPESLGPPPPHATLSNRMSPPGVALFYGALDPETAFQEIFEGPGLFSTGQFVVQRDLFLLDLSGLPDIPGFFAPIPDSQPWGGREATFFHHLLRDFTQPIERDDRIHIEYIPTQVVTEYFRLEFHKEQEAPKLDGIIYPSSREAGGESMVLFCGQEAIGSNDLEGTGQEEDIWLTLRSVEHRRL